MSLIVARIDNKQIYIGSDTKITDEKEIRQNPLSGRLKTVILSPQVCLCYAGVLSYAEDALSIIYNSSINNLNVFLSLLLKINIESDDKTEFGIAYHYNNNPYLFKISNREIISNLSSFWLGDYHGFCLYQETTLNLPDNTPIKEQISLGFKTLIEEKKIPTIGDYFIPISIDKTSIPSLPHFRYEPKLEIKVRDLQRFKLKNGEGKVLSLGTPQGGSYGISYLVTISEKYFGIGIYYPHGRFGVLLCPRLNFNIRKTNDDGTINYDGIIINNVNGKEFMTRVINEYDIRLIGFVLNNDNGMQLLDNIKFKI